MARRLKDLAKQSTLYDPARRLRATWHAFTWPIQGRPIPPPDRVKQKTVKEYARRYGHTTLIETGTYLGDMVASTRHVFDHIFSIELDPVLYARAKKRFSKDRRVHIVCGDSGQVLPELLGSISEPCVFWLDAHYSGDITAKGASDTPILGELQRILDHPARGHVILIDDARCFTGTGDYPSVDSLRALVSARSSNLTLEIRDDIIRICDSCG